jgi:HlyD family secretion protein
MPGNNGMLKKIAILFAIVFISNANAALKTIFPHQGAIQKSFTDLARTRLEHRYDINMPLSGKLERIKLQEGDRVAKGQIITKLTRKPWLQAVNKAKGQLELFKEWYRLRNKILRRDEILRRKSFVSQQELDKSRSYVKMLLAQIYNDQASLIIAKYDLKRSTLRSPINGIILKRYTEGGTWLPEGTALLQIGNLNELEVICDVLTQDAQLLKIGDPVLLSSVGSPVVLHGKVKRIYPAGFTKKSALGVDEQRVDVIISLKTPKAANLGVGYRLQAKFLVGTQQKDALIIPRFSVLQDNQGQYYVFAVKDKKLHKQIIKIGIQTDTKISVISGLNLQDNIIAQPTADMYDGMKI